VTASTAVPDSAASPGPALSPLVDPALVTRAIDFERARLAELTKRGVGMPIAGMLFWIAAAVFVRRWPTNTALLAMFIGTGAVFPIGLAITRAFGGDLFAKSERFQSLGMLFNAAQFFFWPVVILVFRVAPEWTPFTMCVLFGSHFMGYAWLYRSRGYAVLTAGTVVVPCAAVLIAGDALFTMIPLLAAAVYAVAAVVLIRE
jgi:hypothetical protein